MPLKKILFRPGINRENTRYASEALGSVSATTNVAGGWYDADKIRFRAGNPEKIGGWTRVSGFTFLGLCRSLWNWVTLAGLNLMGLTTNIKVYIERDGSYFDITPIRATDTLGANPFAGNGTTTVTVTDTAHGGNTDDYVTFSGATGTFASTFNAEFKITVIDANSYTISTTPTTITAGSYGGSAVVAKYQINVSAPIEVAISGWGAGKWGTGDWGVGTSGTIPLRVWSQNNWGEDLIFVYRGGPLYIWDATNGLTTRAVLVSSLVGADAEVPSVVNFVFVSDQSRFTFCFGCDDYGSSILNPMLIRWSDQESITSWAVSATSQAGSLQLSHGSEIITAIQARQEIVVFTDSTLYSLQYQGPPTVWGAQLLGDNISIQSPNAVAIGSGIVYWMGIDKFYKYDGRIATLRCDLREYIFSDINQTQNLQVFASTSEGFNEVWWFYCSEGSTQIDRYVIYNYGEDIWYYGTDLGRTAWIDSGLRDYPVAATYSFNLVNHEEGIDNNETSTPTAITSTISSSQFDIDDGQTFGFIYRVLPDLTFRTSTSGTTPQVTLTLIPFQNSGTGANIPASTAGTAAAAVQRTSVANIQEFTGQVFMRLRGRQMVFQIDCNTLGTQWQLGAPRIDIKPDGRRGNT
jgi:hypothetical protein